MARGIKRLVLHWAVSAYKPTEHILQSYHACVDHTGKRYWGRHPVEANISIKKGQYAPHIANMNTGSAGISLLGMHDPGDGSWPPGPYPLTQVQIEEYCNLAAEICETWGLDPSNKLEVATHGEFQPNRRPLEMVWLPELGDCTLEEGGDYFRKKIAEKMNVSKPSVDLCNICGQWRINFDAC